MLIRSQNKEILVHFNVSAGIEIEEGPVKTVITSYITGCSYLLGEYSDKEKAIKVLDMIQNAYISYKLTELLVPEIGKVFKEAPATKENELLSEAAGEVIANRMIFQMPEDEEVPE